MFVWILQYKVIGYNGATIREGEELDSKFVTKLPQGSIVVASEVKGRRVKIISPTIGWASIKTESDTPPLYILEQIGGASWYFNSAFGKPHIGHSLHFSGSGKRSAWWKLTLEIIFHVWNHTYMLLSRLYNRSQISLNIVGQNASIPFIY